MPILLALILLDRCSEIVAAGMLSVERGPIEQETGWHSVKPKGISNRTLAVRPDVFNNLNIVSESKNMPWNVSDC